MASMPIVIAVSNPARQAELKNDIDNISTVMAEYAVIKEPLSVAIHRRKELVQTSDVHICSHHLLLKDVQRRATGEKPLLPEYQMLIIEDAESYIPVARMIYNVSLSSFSALEVQSKVYDMVFQRAHIHDSARKSSRKLFSETARLFKAMGCRANQTEVNGYSYYAVAEIDAESMRHVVNIRKITNDLMDALYGEAIYNKAEELLAWVRRHYNADVSVIDLKKHFALLANDDDSRKPQVLALYKSICALPEIEHRLANEMERKKKRSLSSNTEREALLRTESKMLDLIWSKTRLLLYIDTPTGDRSEKVLQFISSLKHIREQAAALAQPDNLIYWIESSPGYKSLCATPRDIGARLLADQWGKRVPTVLVSKWLSDGGDYFAAKRMMGLDNLGYAYADPPL